MLLLILLTRHFNIIMSQSKCVVNINFLICIISMSSDIRLRAGDKVGITVIFINHELRRSCAGLLLADGVPLKQIREWLGHLDFSTTANIYAHLDKSKKQESADVISSIFNKAIE